MELIRDYLIFDSAESSNNSGTVGYDLNDNSIDVGPLFNFFGYDIVGIYSRDDKVVVDLGSQQNPLGKGLTISHFGDLPASTSDSVSITLEDLIEPLSIGTIQIYEIEGGVQETNAAIDFRSLATDQYSSADTKQHVAPLYSRTVKLSDILTCTDSNERHYRLELPNNGFSLQDGVRYCVAISPSRQYRQEKLGIRLASAIEGEQSFTPGKLKSSIRTATAYLNRQNELLVTLYYDDKPIELSMFDRFRLYGLTSTELDSDTDDTFFKFGQETGQIVLSLSDHFEASGEFDTTLVVNGPDFPEGIVLWHRDIIKSRLKITVVDV